MLATLPLSSELSKYLEMSLLLTGFADARGCRQEEEGEAAGALPVVLVGAVQRGAGGRHLGRGEGVVRVAQSRRAPRVATRVQLDGEWSVVVAW